MHKKNGFETIYASFVQKKELEMLSSPSCRWSVLKQTAVVCMRHSAGLITGLWATITLWMPRSVASLMHHPKKIKSPRSSVMKYLPVWMWVEETFAEREPYSSHVFFIFLCRVQTNWKPLRSEAMSMDQGNRIFSSKQCIRLFDKVNAWITLKVLSLSVSLCCGGEEAVTSTPSMALSPTGAWKLHPALPVLTSVSSVGGMYMTDKAIYCIFQVWWRASAATRCHTDKSFISHTFPLITFSVEAKAATQLYYCVTIIQLCNN